MGISLRKAEMCDCGKIHKMQIELFSALLGKYKDYNTSPAAEPIEKTERRMADEFTAYYFICLDDTVIGAVRTVRLNGCKLKISPIFILPLYHRARDMPDRR